jgi:hypothetical protein
MAKKKLSTAKLKALRLELAKLKAPIPYQTLAKRYGVSTNTVSYHWLKIRKVKKPVVVMPSVPPAHKKILLPLAPPMPHPKPNGHITCTVAIDQDWLEGVTREEVMNLVRSALRK